MPLLIALALVLQPPPQPGFEPVTGVVTSVAHGTVTVDVGWDHARGWPDERTLHLGDVTIVWHMDERVTLPPWAIRPGTRVRLSWPYHRTQVAVIGLGPYASRAEDEERYIAAIQALPEATPTEDQVRRGERVRVERAPRGCDLALGPEEVEVIEAMGSCSHLLRECVTKALRERGIASLRTLIWARHAPDEEIRTRAETLLRELGWEG